MSTAAHISGVGEVFSYAMLKEAVSILREQGVKGNLYLIDAEGVYEVVGADHPKAGSILLVDDTPPRLPDPQQAKCYINEALPSQRDRGGESWQDTRQGRKKWKPSRGRR